MKIGLIPISAKPYHAGHHYLVEKASRENDEVIIFASVTDRCREGEFPIYGECMIAAWNELIIPVLPANVSVQLGGSPVRKVYEMIGETCIGGEQYTYKVYSDIVDTKANYPVESRVKYMNPLYESGKVIFVAEEKAEDYIRGAGAPMIRGADLRSCLAQNDYVKFSTMVPSSVNHAKYWQTLTRRV